MMTNVRIAAFGCGYWGRNHIRTLAEMGALAAICDLDAHAAQALADEHGVPFASADDVLADPTIDGVVLALPASVHAHMAMRALDAGKHVFVEKPMALTAHDADAVVAKARSADRVIMVGHILRYHNTFQKLLDCISDDMIGDVLHLQSHRLAFGKFHATFDALWDLAPHDLSLVLSVIGAEPDHVSIVRHAYASEQADAGHIHMRFASGIGADVFVSRHSAYNERKFVAKGTKGSLIWDDWADWPKKLSFVRHTASHADGDWSFERRELEFIPTKQGMALTDELQHYLDCISVGARPFTDGAQGAAVVKILATP
ncbi:MAG: Gfo/Idh/MocA family oxidoreductase [Pseudomonadota bacterium]